MDCAGWCGMMESMETASWITGNWFDLVQTVGIIGSLLIAVYTVRRDEKARKVGNSISISQQYQEIQRELIRHPRLKRIFDENVNFQEAPVSIEEEAFVKMTIGQLSTVYRAMKDGEFVTFEGLRKDVHDFFTLPVPKAVWNKYKSVQDREFILFVEEHLHSDISGSQ